MLCTGRAQHLSTAVLVLMPQVSLLLREMASMQMSADDNILLIFY
jgi:hypothetical protein